MNIRISMLVVACTLALSACGNNTTSNASASNGTAAMPTPAVTVITPMSGAATATTVPGMTSPMAAPASTAAGMNGKPAAVVTNCSTEIEATDAIQYSVSSITVPASCKHFKITLKHTGNLPVAQMGHDLVITKKSDMHAVDEAGAKAGLEHGYLKPDDSRVIAHTKLLGAGESDSVSFPVSKIKDGGPYVFFCSFPGHSALMHGPISVAESGGNDGT